MRFEILGPIRVSARGREIAITAGRERTILATLILSANQTVSTTALVDALWTERAPRDARNQLHGCVSRLRRQLVGVTAAGQIVTEPEGYRLRAGVRAVDLLEFRALVEDARAAAKEGRRDEARDGYRAALGLWRGPALAGIDRGMIRQTAAGLEEERARALEERIDLELALGAGGELIGELTDLVHRYPYRERLHAALMLALYRADRQADALATYRKIRRTLVTELAQEPGPVLRELHHRVLAGDPALRATEPVWSGAREDDGAGANADRAPAEPAPPPASHCLPRTVADFTGRDADLAWLVEAADQADPYAPLVLAIDGMPGVGKTSLVVHAAHQLVPRYSGGCLFIDLHGHSEQRPVEPAAALATLLRQLGVPAAQIPSELDERIVRWRAELASRRVLVVLDNAASSAQVAPLLPTGAGCLALVTSRRRLVELDGARPRSIETLDHEAAVALLARIAGERIRAEPAAAAEVAKRCGHLPLALRLAAARLAHRPRWRVQDLVDRLRDPQAPLAELTAGDRTVADAFALSYGHLTLPGQRMFRRLGLHPGPCFDGHAAAALAGVDLDDARRTLDELMDGHLVQEQVAGRYQLHDLVRTYAAALAVATDPAAQRDRAVAGLLDYLLHATAGAIGRLESPVSLGSFQPGEPARPDLVATHPARGTDWLEAERANLVAAVRQATAAGQDRYACQLARAMWRFLYLRGYLDDLLDTQRYGLMAAERLADPGAVCMMRNYLASAYFRVGRYQEAVDQMRQVVAWREKAGDRGGEAIARKNLAIAYSRGGWPEEADSEADRALMLARRSGDDRVLASVVVNAGDIHMTSGRYRQALRYSRAGLNLAREVGDAHLRLIALGNIGAIRARLGEAEPALRLLTVAMRGRLRAGDRHGDADRLHLGRVCRMLGRLDEAVAHLRAGLVIMREFGDRQGECDGRNELGHAVREAGDPAAALELHRRALASAAGLRYRYGEACALDGIAGCLRDTDPESARRHWLRALPFYQELDLPERHDVERQLASLASRT